MISCPKLSRIKYLALAWACLVLANDGKAQDTKKGETPLTGSLTSRPDPFTYADAWMPFVRPEPPARPASKPYIYPPKTIEAARDTRRVDPGVSVNVTMEKQEYQVMEPIRVHIKVRNNSNERRWYNGSNCSYKIFQIHAYNSEKWGGKATAKTGYALGAWDIGQSGGSMGGDFPPGRVREETLIVNLANEMTWPDEYSFFVEMYTGGLVEIDGVRTPRVARSQEFKVKVVDIPRVLTPPKP